MSYLQTDTHASSSLYKPHSPTTASPPDTPSPASPTRSDENLPAPYVHVHNLNGMSQYTPATTPDSTGDWKQTPPYLNMEEKTAPATLGVGSGAGGQEQASGARERASPTRATGLREQQSQPTHFTPAFFAGATGAAATNEKDEAYQTTMNGGGAQPRRQYANNTPTSYTTPTTYPLTRTPSGSGRAEGSAKAGFYDSPAYWLILYFFFNLGLTLFNKIVLVSFPFPYTLTGLHALSGCAGCYFALERGAFRENLILAAFSVLYTINIAVSNISLQLVTVPFHQVVRASTPLFTIMIATVILRTRFSMMKLISLLPVVAGVGFATYGDYYFTAWGLILTLLGTFLAALKTVVTNLIQTGGGGRLKLHPLDLLMRMSPLAFIQCVVYGYMTGELERVRAYGATQMTRTKAIALLVNGVIACGLNIVSFTANKKAGALTMTVSANCKQVLTIALAVVLFDLHISITNGIGIFLTLVGGGWYGYVEYTEKGRKKAKIVDKS